MFALIIIFVHVGLLTFFIANLVYLWRKPSGTHEQPLVSIIIPARNEERNLQRLLPSLLAQNYPHLEIIVYDDASEDKTWCILNSFDDVRIKAFKGSGPPVGWVGKVHALHQATRHATGAYYLFLDADTELNDEEAIDRLVARFAALHPNSVLTGLPRYQGGGLLLVSLVPNAILTSIPWPLVRMFPKKELSALNGQCWMLSSASYHQHEPHKAVANEILEDVKIGHYLKSKGITPVLVDLKKEVTVYMYTTFADAWRGFRKNAYLLLGANLISFSILLTAYAIIYIVAPFLSIWLLPIVYLNKWATDIHGKFPIWVSLSAPLSFTLGLILQLDSAWHHLIGSVSWKGRSVK